MSHVGHLERSSDTLDTSDTSDTSDAIHSPLGHGVIVSTPTVQVGVNSTAVCIGAPVKSGGPGGCAISILPRHSTRSRTARRLAMSRGAVRCHATLGVTQLDRRAWAATGRATPAAPLAAGTTSAAAAAAAVGVAAVAAAVAAAVVAEGVAAAAAASAPAVAVAAAVPMVVTLTDTTDGP